MGKRVNTGSAWRKWDLHVHLPGTKLSDRYEKGAGGGQDWGRFADTLEASDVAVIGVADYFSAVKIFEFIDFFKERHSQSEKLLLPNIEFRLNESVNKAVELIHFHAVFSDTVTKTEVGEFLAALKTQLSADGGKKLTCANLNTKTHFESATISRHDLVEALKDTFGPDADLSSKVILIAPASNDGIRAARGNQRKAAISDEVDKLADAIFGSASSKPYFLQVDRYEDTDIASAAKPVFSGCDAHSFDDLEAWLGRDVEQNGTRQEVTWIKADPTFAGLQQTLIEPDERVAIQPSKPDAKEPYKVMRRLRFDGGNVFPAEILLNENLNAIIGSRSSGKSALLAHVAHSIDPDYTVEQQMLASHGKKAEMGPAAGKTWADVANTQVHVDWSDGSTAGGSVIFVPQNWLYEISDNAAEVTSKIRPALQSRYPDFSREHQANETAIRTANDAIGRAVERWFALSEQHDVHSAALKKLGDKASITKARDELQGQITQLQKDTELSAGDLALYQTVVADLATKSARADKISEEKSDLSPYVLEADEGQFQASPGAISIEIETVPASGGLPVALQTSFDDAISEAKARLTQALDGLVVTYRSEIENEYKTLLVERSTIEATNKALIDKHEANTALDDLVRRHKEQAETLERFNQEEDLRVSVAKDLSTCVELIEARISDRAAAISALDENFQQSDRTLDDLTFGVAIDFSHDQLVALSEPFKKNETGTYLVSEGEDTVIDLTKAQSSVNALLRDMRSGEQKLNRNRSKEEVSKSVLTATPEVRFTAKLENDIIGGFGKSTMTPGKQALFALTLILNESQDSWPLLIDQPEDDLDSRSIYSAIVPYLTRRKKERQIILVTHNANLVVGADAEEVIVANRHGDDSRNRDDRTFDYLTGSLEHSASRKSAYKLETMGIREHACDILDGGEEAFHKRAEKYKI